MKIINIVIIKTATTATATIILTSPTTTRNSSATHAHTFVYARQQRRDSCVTLARKSLIQSSVYRWLLLQARLVSRQQGSAAACSGIQSLRRHKDHLKRGELARARDMHA